MQLSLHIGFANLSVSLKRAILLMAMDKSVAIIFTQFLLSKTKSTFRFCKGRVVRKLLFSCIHGNKYKSTNSDAAHILTFYDLSYFSISLKRFFRSVPFFLFPLTLALLTIFVFCVTIALFDFMKGRIL